MRVLTLAYPQNLRRYICWKILLKLRPNIYDIGKTFPSIIWNRHYGSEFFCIHASWKLILHDARFWPEIITDTSMNWWARTLRRKVVANKIISTTISPSLVPKQITDDDNVMIFSDSWKSHIYHFYEWNVTGVLVHSNKKNWVFWERKKVDKTNGPMHMLFVCTYCIYPPTLSLYLGNVKRWINICNWIYILEIL